MVLKRVDRASAYDREEGERCRVDNSCFWAFCASRGSWLAGPAVNEPSRL